MWAYHGQTPKNNFNIAQDNRYFFDPENALVRFFYRNPITGPPLRRLAGKTLQKSIVCNKAGTYSAKVQRNDITQEKSYAERAFLLFIQNEDSEMDELKNSIEDGSFAKYLVDTNKKDEAMRQQFSRPVKLSKS